MAAKKSAKGAKTAKVEEMKPASPETQARIEQEEEIQGRAARFKLAFQELQEQLQCRVYALPAVSPDGRLYASIHFQDTKYAPKPDEMAARVSEAKANRAQRRANKKR